MIKESELDSLYALHNPIWVYDIEHYRIHWANGQALAFWEAESAEELYARDFRKDMSEAIYNLLCHDLEAYRDGREYTQWWTLFPKGQRKEVYCHYSGVQLNDGRVAMLAQVVVTQELLQTELSVHSSSTIASLWNSDGHLKSANPMFTDIYGEQPLMFRELFFSPRQAQEVWSAALAQKEYETELYLPTPQGERWYGLLVRVNQSQQGNQFVMRQYDITERKQQELHHQQMALLDQLTGLMNRYGLTRTLEEYIARQRPFSLFFIDLDNFKVINDYYGHDQGDLLLQTLAQRLGYRFANTLCIGRLSGDEFLLVDAETDPAALNKLAQRLMEAICEPFMLEELGEISISASIGVARFPEDGAMVDEMLRHADAAMYQAKAQGKCSHVQFSQALSNHLNRRQRIRQLLDQAICNNEFHLRYRPVVNLNDRRVVACETRLTWRSPELGDVDEDEFLPVAKECGMLGLLRFTGLEKACHDLGQLGEQATPIQLLVRISANQLHTDFALSLRKLLQNNLARADQLILAINEADLLDPHTSRHLLQSIRAMGVGLLAEECGVGRTTIDRASLALLHKVPLTHVKLDAALISGLEPGCSTVVKAANSLADSIGLTLIAQGVTTQAQADLLKAHGCYLCCGPLFSDWESQWLFSSGSQRLKKLIQPPRDDQP